MKNKQASEILGPRLGLVGGTSLAALLAVGLLLTGCGQKGPLVMPAATTAKAAAQGTDRPPSARNTSELTAPR